MNARSLGGRVVLVTGAARGIGAATARALVARGAHVSLVGLEPERLSALAGTLGPDHAWFKADVTDQAAVDAAVAGTVARLGRIDAVVANAGTVNYGTVHTAAPKEFARTIAVNLVGVYRTVWAAVPHLVERRGYVLLVASLASFSALPGGAAYAAAKAGVESFASTLRLELRHDGVAVGSAHPCWIETDMLRDAETAMPSFTRLRARLPWPANVTMPVDRCGEAFADAVQRRARRVYVPRSVALVAAARSLLSARIAERVVWPGISDLIAALDAELIAHRNRA